MSVTEQRVKIKFLQGSPQLHICCILYYWFLLVQKESKDYTKLDKHVQINYKVCFTSKIQQIYIANNLKQMDAGQAIICLNLTRTQTQPDLWL